jgi:hypothetical protein
LKAIEMVVEHYEPKGAGHVLAPGAPRHPETSIINDPADIGAAERLPRV